MDEKDIKIINQIIRNLKNERKRLMEQIKIIDDTLKTISKMLDITIEIDP